MNDETLTETPAKRLRGRYKVALILDLADGAMGYDELASRHGISKQGVAEFASRNRDAIQSAKQDLTSELAGLWVVNKRERLADAQQDLEDLEALLQDPNLTDAARRGYYSLKIKLRHNIAEECGQLPTRATIEVESAPLLRHEIVGWEPARWMDDIRAGASASADDSDPEPVGTAAPATEPSEDGNAERLFRVQPSTASDGGPSAGTPPAPEPPSEVERFAMRLVGQVRDDGSLTLAQLAPGMAQQRVDEVLAFVLSNQWLALRGDRVVLGSQAPLPPLPPPRSAFEAAAAWGPGE
jgi:hypothetical protein